MGKAGRWLRNFFLPGRKGRWKANDRADTDCQSVLSAPLPAPAATSSVREKRRWSFRRPGSAAGKADAGASGGQGPQGPLASSSSHCFSEAAVHVVVVQDDQRAAAEVVNAAAPVASLPPLAPARGCEDEEAAAAIKIQSAYRSYLARKALCALRGMVKLQAMVRGQLVRRQAKVTLRRMQALVDAQRRARADRLRLLEEEDARQQLANTNANATPRQPPSRRSPLHPLSRKPLEALENVKIVEVDDAGVAQGGRQQLLLDDAGPHAGEGRRAVPEGVADAVSADGRERADAQRPVRRRVLELRVGVGPARQRGVARRPPRAGGVRGRGLPELHGEHQVVARQGAAVAERAEAAPLVVSVRVRGGGLAVPVVVRAAAAEPRRERRRAAQGVAGPARRAPELSGAHGAVRVAGPRERGRRRVAPQQRVRVVGHRGSSWQRAGGMAWMTI